MPLEANKSLTYWQFIGIKHKCAKKGGDERVQIRSRFVLFVTANPGHAHLMETQVHDHVLGPVRKFTPTIVADTNETTIFKLVVDIRVSILAGEWVVIADEEFIIPFNDGLTATGLFDRILFEELARTYGKDERELRSRVLVAGQSSGLTIQCFDHDCHRAYDLMQRWLNAETPVAVLAAA